MLGETVSFERAVPGGSDRDTAAPWGLAVALTNWDGPEHAPKESQREALGSSPHGVSLRGLSAGLKAVTAFRPLAKQWSRLVAVTPETPASRSSSHTHDPLPPYRGDHLT